MYLMVTFLSVTGKSRLPKSLQTALLSSYLGYNFPFKSLVVECQQITRISCDRIFESTFWKNAYKHISISTGHDVKCIKS